MGRKGSWFSAIKRVFSPSSKDKVVDGTDKKSSKEKKKKGGGKLKHGGDGHSFIPVFREPSSIEKILGEAEREHHIIKPLSPPKEALPHVTPSVPPPPPPPLRTASLKADASSRASSSLRATSFPSQRVASSPRDATIVNVSTATKTSPSRYVQWHRPQPTLNEQHVCATKIQAAYRGYMARRSYRALRGLVRLQGMVKGQSVKRHTADALKCMQLMVRVQNQIHSRRIQMLESQVQRRQAMHKNDKDIEGAFGRWNLSEYTDEWEDSTLTKEEIDARMQRKVDAIVKRERSLAYAYSQQLWKATPGMAQAALVDLRSGGFPHWRNWLEQRHSTPPTTLTSNPSQSPAIKTSPFTPTPSRPTLGFSFKTSPLPPSSTLRLNQPGLRFDNMDTPTPRSTKSTLPSKTKQAWNTPPGRLQQRSTFKDDDSLMSCPPFSVPHYMAPTASAKAKSRSDKVQVPESPSSIIYESQRPVTFPFRQAIGSFKWKNKGKSGLVGKDNQSMQSLADHLSVDSTVSMPANVGRRPFNRFV